MMARTRINATAIEYIQKHSAMTSMPQSMVWAMLGDFIMETDAPWCSVFHHFTEK
jgi:hypothetical protein